MCISNMVQKLISDSINVGQCTRLGSIILEFVHFTTRLTLFKISGFTNFWPYPFATKSVFSKLSQILIGNMVQNLISDSINVGQCKRLGSIILEFVHFTTRHKLFVVKKTYENKCAPKAFSVCAFFYGRVWQKLVNPEILKSVCLVVKWTNSKIIEPSLLHCPTFIEYEISF